MKITLNADQFKTAVNNAGNFVDRKSISGIFDNFLIEAISQDQITITATDANAHTGAIVTLNVDFMSEPKSFLVDEKRLKETLKGVKTGTVALEMNDTTLSIKSGGSMFKLPVSTVSEYPIIPKVTGKAFEIETVKILDLLQKVTFSISKDRSYTKMTSGFLTYENGKLILVGTDSFQMGYAEIGVAEDLSKLLGKGILLLKEDLESLEKVLKDKKLSEKIQLSFYDDTFTVTSKNKFDTLTTTAWLRSSGSDYVAYKSIFREPAHQATIGKNELKQLLKRAKSSVSKEAPVVVFTLDANKLVVETRNEFSYQFYEELEVAYSSKKITFGISHTFLSKMLTKMKSKKFLLDVKGKEDIIIIKECPDSNYFYLLMPMDI